MKFNPSHSAHLLGKNSYSSLYHFLSRDFSYFSVYSLVLLSYHIAIIFLFLFRDLSHFSVYSLVSLSYHVAIIVFFSRITHPIHYSLVWLSNIYSNFLSFPF